VLGMEINLAAEKLSYQKVMNMHPMSDLAVFVRTVIWGALRPWALRSN
jgi:hypothetical protein